MRCAESKICDCPALQYTVHATVTHDNECAWYIIYSKVSILLAVLQGKWNFAMGKYYCEKAGWDWRNAGKCRSDASWTSTKRWYHTIEIATNCWIGIWNWKSQVPFWNHSNKVCELQKSAICNNLSFKNIPLSHSATVKDMQDKWERDKDAFVQLHDEKHEELLKKHLEEKVTLTNEMTVLKEHHQAEVKFWSLTPICQCNGIYHMEVFIVLFRLQT